MNRKIEHLSPINNRRRETHTMFGTKLYYLALLAIIFLLDVTVVLSQKNYPEKSGQAPNEVCGTTKNMERLMKNDPALREKMDNYDKQIQQWIAANPNARSSANAPPIVIPTVIHVVWKTASENISDIVCNDIIQVLNEDYGRTNSDTTQTPAVWKPIAANTGIQFCLAQRDPLGAPSNGIERRQTVVSAFSTDDKVKSFSTGGLDAWDVTRFFNIWICDLAPGLGGYGEFPVGSPSNTFGNVTDYTAVGIGEWICTHECGHCFNLRHIWADDGTACTGTDLISDTPNQAGSTSGCPGFPATDACSPASPGYMFMNYMDYSDCKNLFTAGQSNRINAVFASPPYNALTTSNGCTPIVLVADDAGCFGITIPGAMVCSTAFAPVISLRNWGNNTLLSATINYQVDAGPINTFNWTGSLASLAIESVTLPSITTTAGTHTFTCYTTMPNTVADGNTANDQRTSNFNLIASGQALPLTEGFEGLTFPPTGWTLYNPDASVSWARTAGAAKTGIASMWFNSKGYPCNGCVDEITLPNLDMTSVSAPQLTFQVAYRMLSDPSLNPNWSDTLRVMTSTDCGQTWATPYFNYSTTLTTIIPTFSTVAFIPAASNWRLEAINLNSIASSANALIKFKVSSDFENNMYVDDINISSAVGIDNSFYVNDISLYPNPSNGTLHLDARFAKPENLKIYIYNVLGVEVGRTFADNTKGGSLALDMTTMPNGVYFVKVQMDSEIFTRKIVLNK